MCVFILRILLVVNKSNKSVPELCSVLVKEKKAKKFSNYNEIAKFQF